MDTDPAVLLRIYDERLRGAVETTGADSVRRIGPLHLATFPGGRGFVGYRDLAGADAATLREWAGLVVDHFRADPAVTDVEWKTRGHDDAPGLDAVLLEHGFEAGDPESVMLGPAERLAVDVALPGGVTVRRVTDEADVRAASAAADEAFGRAPSPTHADDLLRRLGEDPDVELWVAEADGRVVGSGRLEPVPGTEVAGVWGGSVLAPWRGQGIYRVLTAARARSALRLGYRYLQSDSTEYSRPILERSGLVRVTTTTPYEWHRAPAPSTDGAR